MSPIYSNVTSSIRGHDYTICITQSQFIYSTNKKDLKECPKVLPENHDENVCQLLGNVVISKKFLRTRKIMVMRSNERGECCPRTLVDRKRKRYDNAVDVVVRLHGPTDQAPKLRHL